MMHPCKSLNDTGMNPCEVDGTGCTLIVLVFVDEKQWLYPAPEWLAGAERS